MKRMFFYLFAACLLLSLSAQGQTPLYMQYAANKEDLSVACVIEYHLDSALTVDVTMLRAKTDSGWDLLQRDFALETMPLSASQTLQQGGDVLMTRFAELLHPQVPVAQSNQDDQGSCFEGVDYRDRAVWVFQYHSPEALEFLQHRLGEAADRTMRAQVANGAVFYCYDSHMGTQSGLLASLLQK